jgi:Tfp pilus assembly protein PilN
MVNLLPVSYRRQQIIRKRAWQWTTIIAVVLVSGWGWHWFEMHEQRQLTQQLDVLSREHAPTQTMLKQVVDMRRQLKDLQHQEVVAKELETQRNALTLLGVISNTAQKTKGRLRITKFELTNFQNVGGPTQPGAVGPPPGGLVLAGVALDNTSVAELLEGLQHSGIFTHVDLKNSKARNDTTTALRDYEIRCTF